MAWMPNVVRKNIRPGSNDPAIDVVGVILHVAVSESSSLFPYFNGPSGGIESHFYIRRDGTIEQYRSTGYEADANYKANSFYEGGRRKGFLSVETQGMGHGEWTPQQMASIKRLLAWASKRHNFPLRKATSSRGPGVGYHSQYPGVWTPYAGKSCPGPDRIKQFHNELVPWMRQGAKTPTKQEDDMAWEGKKYDIIPAPKGIGGYGKKNPTATPKHALSRAWGAAEQAARDAAHARAHAEANTKKLDTLLDRTLTEAERDKRLKRIADELAERLTKIEIEVSADVKAGE